MDEIQIVFALAVLYVTYRWWSRPGSSAPGSTTSSSSSSQGTPNERLNSLARDSIPPSHIAQVQAMFPQLDEGEIKWEFVRTGRVRNVEQVVQFFLDSPPSPPPAWFLAPVVTPPPAATSTKTKAKHPSLIERLGLQKQAQEQDQEFSAYANSSQGTFSSDKGKLTDRRALDEWRSMSMQEKKAKMVLNARRSVLEKDRKAQA